MAKVQNKSQFFCTTSLCESSSEKKSKIFEKILGQETYSLQRYQKECYNLLREIRLYDTELFHGVFPMSSYTNLEPHFLTLSCLSPLAIKTNESDYPLRNIW